MSVFARSRARQMPHSNHFVACCSVRVAGIHRLKLLRDYRKASMRAVRDRTVWPEQKLLYFLVEEERGLVASASRREGSRAFLARSPLSCGWIGPHTLRRAGHGD